MPYHRSASYGKQRLSGSKIQQVNAISAKETRHHTECTHGMSKDSGRIRVPLDGPPVRMLSIRYATRAQRSFLDGAVLWHVHSFGRMRAHGLVLESARVHFVSDIYWKSRVQTLHSLHEYELNMTSTPTILRIKRRRRDDHEALDALGQPASCATGLPTVDMVLGSVQ